MQNFGVKSIQTHSERSVENTCPSSPYTMAEKKKHNYIIALLELKSCTKRCLCVVVPVLGLHKNDGVARRISWGRILVRSSLGLKNAPRLASFRPV